MARSSRILVPIKGYAIDQETLTLACTIAKRDKGTVYALYVIEVKRSLPLDVENDEELQRGELLLENAEQIARKADYHIETTLLQAREVGPAIVDEATERAVDLIILGAPYRRRFGEFDLGRTIPYVLKNAPSRVWFMREVQTPDRPTR
ncbi:MAG: universal stress protein [Dehalococcoidia bacterium]|nr:universal stress protein [Dehalococcoidia bacterium]